LYYARIRKDTGIPWVVNITTAYKGYRDHKNDDLSTRMLGRRPGNSLLTIFIPQIKERAVRIGE
jgi:hypothetical protein